MSRTVKIMLALTMVIVLTSGSVYSQEGLGGTRSVFSLGVGARAIAMGGAFSGIGDDPTVLYYNPAALRLNGYSAVTLNHIGLFSDFSDASIDFIGVTYPTISVGALGAAFMTAGTGGIREFDRFSREGDEISYRESQFILGYAFNVPWDYLGKITVGSSMKVLSQRVGDYADNGMGIDVGVLYRPNQLRGLILGCNIQDAVGAETKLVSVTEKVYRTIMVSAGYSLAFKDNSSLSVAAQMDMPQKCDNDIRLGAEYSYRGTFSFRVGFDSEQVTAGVGISWHGLQVDYGYFGREEAGSSHPVSLSANIGESLAQREKILAERREDERERRIREIFSGRVLDLMESAMKYRREGELEKALDELKIALDYDPSNSAVAETLAVVREGILEDQKRASESERRNNLINDHFRRGLDYYSNNEYLLAREEWKQVLALDGNNQRATDYLTRTEDKLEERTNSLRSKAINFEREGNLAAALGEWYAILSIEPDMKEAESAVSRITEQMREMGQKYRETASELNDINLFEDALHKFSSGEYVNAIELLERLLERRPNHEEAAKLLRRARRRITPLSTEEKERIRKLYIDGMRFFTENEYLKAIEQWKKILDIDPDNESVMKNIEEARGRLNKLKEGKQE
jgi:tetratricopeptide (TPR) repeat protein